MRRIACLSLGAVMLLAFSSSAPAASADEVSHWNTFAVRAVRTAGQNAVTGSRTIAMVQIAVHDALNTIDGRYQRYVFTGDVFSRASADAAIATAAHDALVGAINVGALPFAEFGSLATQGAAIALANTEYANTVNAIPNSQSKTDGIAIGGAAAAAIVALRNSDHATDFVGYTPGTRPGDWQPTANPIPFDPPAAADHLPAGLPGWGRQTTWVLHRSDQFRANGPPALTSPGYTRDYDEVKEIGKKNSVTRTPEQTSIARFWFEGSPFGWSRIANVVADNESLDVWERARLLALVNMAMADGFIAGFETKYVFNFWRPVTAIRAGDSDGNDATEPDATWETLLNSPAIPDYTSTHSVLGGAAAQVLSRFFGRDDVPFTTMSGVPFAGITRSFQGFSDAAHENGESRIYAGIHFRSAVEEGIAQGEHIGQFVFEHSLRPIQ